MKTKKPGIWKGGQRTTGDGLHGERKEECDVILLFRNNNKKLYLKFQYISLVLARIESKMSNI